MSDPSSTPTPSSTVLSAPPTTAGSAPVVGIIMGSESDHDTMRHAAAVLRDFGVPFEIAVTSAHRTPERMVEYATSAASRGLRILIAGAGGAAHLPGMVSALTPLPVLGVPVQSKALNGLDSLLSIVQMPAGIPTATFAIGEAGARNAGLFAVRILAALGAESPLGADEARHLQDRLDEFHAQARAKVVASSERVAEQWRNTP